MRENSAQRTQALAPAGWDSIPEVVVTTRESENYLVSRISRFSYLFRVARIGYDVLTGVCGNGVLGRGSESVHVCSSCMCVNN